MSRPRHQEKTQEVLKPPLPCEHPHQIRIARRHMPVWMCLICKELIEDEGKD